MKNELTITLVQTDNHWEKIDDNLDMLSNKLFGIDEEIDVLILPELFTTGFTMTGTNLGESMDGKTVTWMKEWAHKKDCLVAGSVLIEEEGKMYNRFIAALPEGEIGFEKIQCATPVDPHISPPLLHGSTEFAQS